MGDMMGVGDVVDTAAGGLVAISSISPSEMKWS